MALLKKLTVRLTFSLQGELVFMYHQNDTLLPLLTLITSTVGMTKIALSL